MVQEQVQAQVASALAAHSSVTGGLTDIIMAEQMNISRRLDELQSTTDVPSTIGTSTSSAMSALARSQDQVSELQRQLALARVSSPPPPPSSTPWCAPTTRTPPRISNPWETGTGTNSSPGGSRRNAPNLTDRPRRQWTGWCSTCGVVINHNSGDCFKPGPNHNKNATKANPMGGNTKRDHLWMKWCNPGDSSICDRAVD